MMNQRATWKSKDGAVLITARRLTTDERGDYPQDMHTRVTICQTLRIAEDNSFKDVRLELLLYKWSSIETGLRMGKKYYNKYMAPPVPKGRPSGVIKQNPIKWKL
jgi:hypothetical protein